MVDIKLRAQAELELRRRYKEKMKSFDSFLLDLHPTFDWDLPHLVYMRRYLDRIIAGETLKVMFFVGPQHGKSTQNTVAFTSFYMLTYPTHPVILAAYGAQFSADFSIDIRDIVGRYKKLKTEAANRWKLEAGGGLRAGSVGGSAITGYPSKLFVVDDPIKGAEAADSIVQREAAWKWWVKEVTARMRVNTSCIFTMTRWHMDDLASRILDKEGDKWIVVNIPTLAEEDDILGRKAGEPLWNAEFPASFLLEKRALDPKSFEAMYQGHPVAAEGAIIKRDSINYYDQDPGRYDYILQSWDTAFKKGEENDYSAMTTWGCIDNKKYLIDAFRDKLEYPELKTTLMQYADKWKPNLILVEDKASGQSITQDLRRTSPYPISPITPNGDKVMRCNAITDSLKSSLVLFPKEKEWLIDYINELCTFPSAKYDDWVDSTTQALIYLHHNYTASTEAEIPYDPSNFPDY